MITFHRPAESDLNAPAIMYGNQCTVPQATQRQNPTFFLSTGVRIRVSGLIVKSDMSGTVSGDRSSDVANRLWVEPLLRVMWVEVWLETGRRMCRTGRIWNFLNTEYLVCRTGCGWSCGQECRGWKCGWRRDIGSGKHEEF